ncbi:uncharacterized protein EV420DRAFT_256935 [Desarmillaria tabescens]|uniref:F-box domain-containing protein n=1 Tax=Armillaria tabescens TaxID=1929756 RepID=A0AA39KJ06_ARMTA|nr:uncharacterized protein EV420DRAFT_256935 [Desarmillaria tabescens]KAK0460258.1 hypothetical protein EV420DRAFT_256935 [Desarmillaria tabescens]
MTSDISCSICGSTGEPIQWKRLHVEESSEQETATTKGFGDLPPNVLKKIFLSILDETGFNFSETSQGPWIFAYVCSSWRAAALDYPCLWSNIILNDSSFRTSSNYPASSSIYSQPHCPCSDMLIPRQRHDLLSLLSTVLSRAGQHDLSLHVDFSKGYSDPYQSFIMRVLLLRLAQKSNQWNIVFLQLPRNMVDDLFGVYCLLPRLVSLHLVICTDTEMRNCDMIRVFEMAPMLVFVTLQGLAFRTYILLPWQQLVYFYDDRNYRPQPGINALP